MNITLPDEIRETLENGADLAISVSGGKDSDAMAVLLAALHREHQWPGRISLIHADLGRAEWPQTLPHIRALAQQLELPLAVVRRAKGDLVDRWWQRYHTLRAQGRDVPPWSSPAHRYCTSDLKVGPIDQWLRAWTPQGTVICAVGLRAQESRGRAQKPEYTLRKKISTRRRTGWTWHPLLHFGEDEVWAALGTSSATVNRLRQLVAAARSQGTDEWAVIRQAGWRWHPAYLLGNTRLSCALCVLASQNDLTHGATYNVELYRELVALEQQSGFAFQAGRPLADLRPDLLATNPEPVSPVTNAVQLSLFETPA